MATLELNGKSLATQTSSDEPVIASPVTGAPALALTNATGALASAVTRKISVTQPFYKYNTTSTGYGDFVISGNISSNSCAATLVVPNNFVSLDGLSVWMVTGTNASFRLTYEWQASAHGQNYQTHASSDIEIIPSTALTISTVYKYDIYNIEDNGADVEDVIAIGDVYAVRINETVGSEIYGICVEAIYTVTA